MMLERHLRAAGWLVSAAALAGVVIWALWQPAPRAPQLPWLIAVAVGLYAGATLVRAERWRLLLRFNGCSVSRLDCHALTCVGYMGNNVLPARAGDAMRVLYMTPRSDASARTVIGTLVAERVLDVLVLFSLYAVLAVVLGAGTLSAGHFAFAAIARARSCWQRSSPRSGCTAVATSCGCGRSSSRRLAATRNLRGRHGAEALGVTLLVWTIEAGVWLRRARRRGLHVSALEALYLLALASLFVFIPAGPGTWKRSTPRWCSARARSGAGRRARSRS